MKLITIFRGKLSEVLLFVSLAILALGSMSVVTVIDDSSERLVKNLPASTEYSTNEVIEVEIPRGLNVGEIAEIISDKQMGADSRDILTLIGLLDSGRLIRAGTYTMEGSQSSGMVVAHLLKGPDNDYILDFQPGLRNEEILATLISVSQFTLAEWESAVTKLVDSRSDSFLLSPQLQANNQEHSLTPTHKLQGYLHPGAYMIDESTSLFDLLAAMFDNLASQITDEMLTDAAKNGFTIREVIILASIIEREVSEEAELPLVASVFFNRLDDSIPLQSDATVQFALAEDKSSVDTYGWWKQAVQQEDLTIESAYNTFQVMRLPPGPISNPSLQAIMAVIYPAETEYLFFLTSPNCDGTHNFAGTYKEHLENMTLFNSSECASSIQ